MIDMVFDCLRNRIPRKHPLRIERHEGDFLIVLPKYDDSRLVALNRTAIMIYRMCDGSKSVGSMCSEFASLYNDVDEQEIKKDLITCLRDLECKGLLTMRKPRAHEQ